MRTWNQSTKFNHHQKLSSMEEQNKKTEDEVIGKIEDEKTPQSVSNDTEASPSETPIENNEEKQQPADAEVERLQFEKELMKTPIIHQDAYDHLPELFRQITAPFEGRERDVLLISSIIVLSGTIPSVTGMYDGKTVHANLNGFIVAPPAAGKGVMVFAKSLGDKIHENKLAKYRDALLQYEENKAQQKKIKKKKSSVTDGEINALNESTEPMQYPKRTLLFIPGNSSSASVIDHLSANDGNGIICETEADTIVNTFKQDWGGYSDILRKSFHHEAVSFSRKKDGEYAEISKPKLSVLLSSTPDQVISLIQDSSNGLFSRFIFYAFDTFPEWRNVFAKNDLDLEAKFENLSDKIFETCRYIERFKTKFKLTDWQENYLNETLSGLFEKYVRLTAGDSASFVKRFGLIWFRIAMIFSSFRQADSNEFGDFDDIECKNSDFAAAGYIITACIKHNLLMYEYLKDRVARKSQFKRSSSMGIHRFYDRVPNGELLSRAEMVEIGKKLSLSASSVDKYLKRLVSENLLDQLATGVYQKN